MDGGKRNCHMVPGTLPSAPGPQFLFLEKLGVKSVGLTLDRKSA